MTFNPNVKQSGSVTPGHVAVWANTGIIEDGGPTVPPPPASNIVEQSGTVTPTHIVKWAATGVVEDGGSGGTWRGDWASGTQYFYLDFVVDSTTGDVYSVLTNYTSGASVAADVTNGDLTLAIDIASITNSIASLTINKQTGTTYTLHTSDNGNMVSMNNASPCTVTLPNSLPQGFDCLIQQEGAGQVTVSPAAGATMQSPAGANKTTLQYSMANVVVFANGSGTAARWRLTGDISL